MGNSGNLPASLQELWTLSATWASTSDVGLFLTRPGLDFEVKPCYLRCKTKDRGVSDVTLVSTPPNFNFQPNMSPLQKRGWAFQERLISRRNIHFARDSVFWECCEVKASECHPSGIEPFPGVLPKSAFDSFMHISPKDWVIFKDEWSSDQIYVAWNTTISTFTGTNFSFFRDRLPAVSGLAKMFQGFLKDKYYAGLWTGSLEIGLAYHASSGYETPSINVEGFRGPSWSWAACWFHVFHCPNDWKSNIRVLSIHVESEASSSSVDGFVFGGRVRIRGVIAQFDLASMGYEPVPDSVNAFRIVGVESDSETPEPPEELMELVLDGISDPLRSLESVLCLKTATVKINAGKDCTGSIVLKATGRRDGDIQEFIRIGFVFLPRRLWLREKEERTIDIV